MKAARSIVIATVLAIIAVCASAPLLADGGAAHQVKQTPPVKMGTSGGSAVDASNAFCCGGTLGALVVRDGVTNILSNNHVLARSGSAVTGEDDIQPGLIDVGCRSANANIVGDFAGNIVPLGTANVDAALSVARAGAVDTTGAIIDVGVPCSNTQTPVLGLAVMKSGRTTGFTTGSISSVSTSVSIQYQKGCNSGKKFTIGYTNQIVTGAMSAGGDSGSLLLSNDGTPNPVGLLYAGSSSSTVYNPIQHVVNAFTAGGHTFSFVGSACAGALAPSGEATESALAGGPSVNDLDFVRTIKERHEPDLFARPRVIGVGVGAADDDSTEAVIVVYLETPKGARPDPRGLPTELDGVKVKVIPTDPFVSMVGGCSGSN